MAKSVEELVEDKIKQDLTRLNIAYYYKTQSINDEIDQALSAYPSKSGGGGKNYPDIKLFLQTPELRKIPVMIEVKGTKGKLAKLKNGEVENRNDKGEAHYKNISEYALNGAVHYANAILDYAHSYDEVIALGINGFYKDDKTQDLSLEYAFYYLNRKNLSLPKKIADYTDLSSFSKKYLQDFISKIDALALSEKERESLIENLESDIETKLNKLNQFLHDDLNINANARVALLVGMIMAAQGVKDNVAPLKLEDLKGESGTNLNDGTIFIARIKEFLEKKNLPKEKAQMVINDLEAVFLHSNLWKQSGYVRESLENKDQSPLKKVYAQVLQNILPLVRKLQTADIAGRLFNSITKWLEVPDNEKNDVVLTPRYVVDLMVALCRVNKDSYVWDYATGSGAFLISAMNAMIKDCQAIQSPKEKESKIAHIKAYQLLGIEKRNDIYLLGILNMILLDDGSANLLHKDSLTDFEGKYEQGAKKDEEFPADVFLLNPPYSAPGKGFIFVERALKKMSKGRACVIIQENAGSGNGLPYTKEILEHSTLIASIKMPSDLFAGKSSVQTAIYLFEVGTPHNPKQQVKFIDFSNDGYTRAARKKAKASTNLKDTDNAKARYEELVNLLVYNHTNLHFYKDCFVQDCINLEGRDWTFAQHKKIDTKPTLSDFKKCVSEYLAWEVSNVLKNQNKVGSGELKSPRLAELEKTFKQNGGEWREFKIGDLFEIKPTKAYKMTNATLFETSGDVPVVTNSSANNGISGYVSLEPTEKGNTITYSDTTTSEGIFYQPRDFVGYSHVQGLYPLQFKESWNRYTLLYFVGVFRKSSFGRFDYGNKFNRNIAKEMKVILPTKDSKIAFDFMESFIQELEEERIQELEEERIQELEAYLLVAGLKNTTLSPKEKEALEIFAKLFGGGALTESKSKKSLESLESCKDSKLSNFEDSSLEFSHFANNALSALALNQMPTLECKWQEFKIGDLFSVKSNPQLNKDSFTFAENAPYPYFTRTCLNNGIAGYVEYLDEEHKIKGNSIAVGMLGMQFFYMEKDFYAGQFTKTIYPKFENFNAKIALFFVACLNKAQSLFQGVLVRDFEKVFNQRKILLPIKDSKIAFDVMESFIKAIEKAHIQSLYEFWQEKLNAYESVMRGGAEFKLEEYLAFYADYKTKAIETKTIEWREFKIGELFEKINTRFLGKGNKFEAVSKFKTDEFCVPVVYAKFGNNGIMYWSKNGDFETYENILSIVYNGAIAAGKVYAQKEKTGILAESYFIKLKNINVSFEVNLFLQCVLEKVLYPKYSRDNLATWNKVKENSILLPVYPNQAKNVDSTSCHSEGKAEESQNTQTKNTESNYTIAFDFMESFIKAIEKESIKDVVLWGEKKLKAYKACVHKA
ncbi:restriction endonuclease subunit S [Helicobacter himalayensis]|uniref:restriction endonuclease subunit S n=1 Tax=Helicobacter himalayensis TaxID=1591088 RepID=UPI0009EDF386|nr:restriction endonuclease subunit S [Helicobacter himalayensis]